MTLYIYNADTMAIVAEIEGINNADCEQAAADQYPDTDQYGWSYTDEGLTR